jgi:hypothetical protein
MCLGNYVASIGRRRTWRNEDGAGDRDQLAVESGGAMKDAEGCSAGLDTRTAALERPNTNEAPRSPWNFTGLNVVKRFCSAAAAEAEKGGQYPDGCKPRRTHKAAL